MATVRAGGKGALVVVDVQVGVVDGAWEADRVVGNVARAIDRARLDVSHVALAGAATNWCIRATAYGALERGYDLTLVADAHTTGGDDARQVVEDLNTVVQWVSYADVSNASVMAEELDFNALRSGSGR